MENYWEYAAATFVTVQFIKFAWGWVSERFEGLPEIDSMWELVLCIIVAFLLTLSHDGTSGDTALAAAIAFLTITVWATVQLVRMRTLFQMTRGGR